MARFLSGSPKIMFALYSAVILLLGIVLIIEKMPDGNKAFEWSAEQTLLLTEKVLISNRYITVSAIDRSLKEYKNPFNQLWQKLTHRSFAWIDSTSHFPDLKPEEQFPNESASQYLGRLCEFPQKKSEEQFFNESASQYLERLCERRRLLKDSISNNINVPETVEQINAILKETAGCSYPNPSTHWKIYSAQIRLQTTRMHDRFLNLAAAKTSSCEIIEDAFIPEMVTSNLFPIVGRPFKATFLLSNVENLFMEYKNGTHCFANGTELPIKDNKAILTTTFTHPGPQPIHILIKRTGPVKQPDITADFQITVPPPCPPTQ